LSPKPAFRSWPPESEAKKPRFSESLPQAVWKKPPDTVYFSGARNDSTEMFMQIANPIYDSVFKYMMDDSKVAKLLLSAIIDSEIEELEFRPTERSSEKKDGSFTVYQLDFAARIKDKNGQSRLVLIEIQKAKFQTDIMRFRKYLGGQYANAENAVRDPGTGLALKALPIVSIYFIGHKLPNVSNPVIKVGRVYTDRVSSKVITAKDEFIESLTHDSYVIQIPCLREKHRNDLEAILTVFNQKSMLGGDKHFLNINSDLLPEKFRPVIRRLEKAAAEMKVRKNMDVEDDVLSQLENLERAVLKRDKALEEKNKALEEKDKALEEKDKALEEKDKIIEELKKRINGSPR
jgi:hypothetical protein